MINRFYELLLFGQSNRNLKIMRGFMSIYAHLFLLAVLLKICLLYTVLYIRMGGGGKRCREVLDLVCQDLQVLATLWHRRFFFFREGRLLFEILDFDDDKRFFSHGGKKCWLFVVKRVYFLYTYEQVNMFHNKMFIFECVFFLLS